MKTILSCLFVATLAGCALGDESEPNDDQTNAPAAEETKKSDEAKAAPAPATVTVAPKSVINNIR